MRAELNRQLEAQAGMTLQEHDVLWQLANVPDRQMSMSQVADLLLITRSGATRVADRLERHGWVRRRIAAPNRRVTYIVLTESGTTAVRESYRVSRLVRKELFDSRLSKTDLADLHRITGKLTRRLDLLE